MGKSLALEWLKSAKDDLEVVKIYKLQFLISKVNLDIKIYETIIQTKGI